MDIEPDIANWVLEFLLRQPLEDRTLNSLLRSLPLRNENPSLKKLLLLKKLQSEVSRHSISERTLEALEQLEEIEFQQGNEKICDSMKRAYCAVAVECTAKILANGDDCSRFKFFEAVKRVWRGKIERMEKVVEKGGLGSEDLWVWKDEIEAAVWDDDVGESVVKKSGGVNAAEAINDYLREETEKMGPSFLELVAARVKDDEIMRGMLGVGSVDQVTGKEAPLDTCGLIKDVRNVIGSEIQKDKVHLRHKLVGLKRSRGLASGNSRRAKIVDSDENTPGPSNGNYNLQCSREVNKVREATESSSLELQPVVKEPLPDALQLAEPMSGTASKSKCHDPGKENHVETNLFIVDGAGVVQAIGYNTSNVRKPSLMEWNSSARIYEWDDSIDGSQEDPADYQGRLQLPSARMKSVSPLKENKNKNSKKRRTPKKWSLLEEDTLRTGVEKYGKGNWKFIITVYRDIFEERTEVDLKDKWRNMTRG